MPSIDWRRIRALRGSQNSAFEELCCQLADAERPAGSAFVRKGVPDGGVECYACLADGSECAWQAKYFDSLGETQLAQINHSVTTALEKHPKLSRCIICLPFDLPDPRIEDIQHARDRWTKAVANWEKAAKARGMAVAFELWGSYELIERLNHPQHAGRVHYWFDATVLSLEWFELRLTEAVKAAGPRYSPEIHVDLPIAKTFETLARTPEFFSSIKAHGRKIRDARRSLGYAAREAERHVGSKDSERQADEKPLASSAQAVDRATELVLNGLSELTTQLTGALQLEVLARAAASAIEAAHRNADQVSKTEAEERERRKSASSSGTDLTSDRLGSYRAYLYKLIGVLRDLADELDTSTEIANSHLLLVTGRAGTGKTHLFCDVARARLTLGRPTILLMGQRFLTEEPPWTQALQHLDLARLSAAEFVGALDAAAQAAECRALILIDALNEGKGRMIWPAHLAAFMSLVERSSCVVAAASVREAYERLVVPDDVRDQIPSVEHFGFADHEFDAVRTFFDHFGLERPSTPLLLPEFRNPLFLKILCRGLQARGETRLPRGYEGISATFGMYLANANRSLSLSLNYNEKASLVQRAADVIADELAALGQPWLPRARAEELVNALLPDRPYDKSLYSALVADGILAEEVVWDSVDDHTEVVVIGYERLSDHSCIKRLLDKHLDQAAPHKAFLDGGELAHVADSQVYLAPGRLEALCIQVPERTGRELADLVPSIEKRFGFADAFRESLLWRDPKAFQDSTLPVLRRTVKSEEDIVAVVDLLVSLATVPEHPINADYIDRRLRKDQMAERDVWWSISVHKLWNRQASIGRLVDWAWRMRPDDRLDEATVDLAATTLAWLCTTSNRYARDRATKALVSLLTGRLPAVGRLVASLADVDDLYVAERVLAAAYACAMRSNSLPDVGALAQTVFDVVFKVRPPRAHVLFRDYGRGVIERALHLGWKSDLAPELFRPPYGSRWPTIPSEADIEKFKEDWTNASYDGGQLEWSRNRIANSVLSDDFARYVIGTNSGMTNWLSVRLDQPPWESPKDVLDRVVGSLQPEQKALWEAFERLDDSIRRAAILARFSSGDDAGEGNTSAELPAAAAVDEELERACDAAMQEFMQTLDEPQAEILVATYETLHGDTVVRPPEFDLAEIQRYVLARVFELGWTTERFGEFDRFEMGYGGRDAHKAERIGKKYQWIAYHEIMAFVADNFQYREWSDHLDSDRKYEGPWQEFLRDIDPSCTLRTLPEPGIGSASSVPWWAPHDPSTWDLSTDLGTWVRAISDIPPMATLLSAVRPNDCTRWLNLDGYWSWHEEAPADRDAYEIERRNLWLMARGYLIAEEEADAFLAWAASVDFMGRWMPEPPTHHRMFLGEHGWSPASRYFSRPYYGDSGWKQPEGCPAAVRAAAVEYLKEMAGFDCSVDGSYTLHLPCSDLIATLKCAWNGTGATFVNSSNQIVSLDPSSVWPGPSGLLLEEQALGNALSAKRLTVCWAVLGEKRILTPGFGTGRYVGHLSLTGAFRQKGRDIVGFLNGTFIEPRGGQGGPKRSVAHVVESSS
ncbi:MAG TPA: AVAST type 2 anti-phage system protein Avs2 [Dehalococcoidia bacterium]|nr:AVAST type 2 anti-phage system protein Avs2 [Dehalococcoidia bacterium]